MTDKTRSLKNSSTIFENTHIRICYYKNISMQKIILTLLKANCVVYKNGNRFFIPDNFASKV